MSQNNDLTQGVIWKKLLLYFLPIVAGTLFQQLYNAVDAIIVGKYVGTAALAAVGGSPTIIINLLIGFFVAFSGGACVVIAQHFGAQEKARVEQEIHTSITFCILIGILLSLAVCFVAPELLRLLKTPTETLSDAILYTRIYFSGSVFVLLFNMGSGILRAMGNSKKPFLYLAISCGCNICLDLFFVIVMKMGVSGVAWATVAAQGISTVFILTDLIRGQNGYKLHFRKLGIRGDILRQMLKIGVPSGLQSAMYGVSNAILQVGVNTLGTVVVASWSMSGKIDGVYWATASAFGMAVTNFVGQNYGANRPDRIRSCVKTSFLLFSVITAVLCTLILGLAQPLLRIFTNDAAVVETTWQILTYFVPMYLLWTVIELLCGVMRGAGDAVKPMIIIALGVCLLRVIWVLTVFKAIHSLLIISLCYPISWGVTDIALLLYYRKGSKIAQELPPQKHSKQEKALVE